MIQIREGEGGYNKKTNGDVLFKKTNKQWTLKGVTTYTFLNERLSFPTSTPLHAVNMHA